MEDFGGEQPQLHESSVVQPERSDSARVLVIEDDVLTRGALSALLRREGYDVGIATNGAEGLVAFREQRPDIILLDLYLPVMDGFEFMERLTAEEGRGRTKVLVLSAADRLDLVHVRLGADAYIAKPFDPERLRAALSRLALQARRKRV